MHQHWKQALEFLDRVDTEGDLDPVLAARVLTGRAWIRGFDTNSTAGRPDADAALSIGEALGDQRILAHAYITSALGYQWTNQTGEGLQWFQAGYDAAASVRDEWAMGWNSMFAAWIYRTRADTEETDRWTARARTHFLAAGSKLGQAWALAVDGIMHRYRFDYEASVESHRQSLALLEELGDRGAASFTHNVIAISLSFLGRHEEAIEATLKSTAMSRDLGRLGVEELSVTSQTYRNAGQHEKSIEPLYEALPLVDSSNEASALIYAEDIADLAAHFELYDLAAPLVAWAKAARIRVDRPVPGPFKAERDKTDHLLRTHVVDYEKIKHEWSDRSKDDLEPLIRDALDRIAAVIEAT